MKPDFPPDPRAEVSSQRILLTLWLTTALSALALGIVAALAAHLAIPLNLNTAFLAQFTLDGAYFDANQPAESLAFEIGCIATPFVIALAYFLSFFLVGKCEAALLPLALRLAIGVTWLSFLWAISSFAYCPHPPLEGMPPWWLLSSWFFVNHPLSGWLQFFSFAVVEGFIFLLLWDQSRRNNLKRAFIALLVVGILIVPSNAYTSTQINDDWMFTYHFNVVLHALSQVIDGHHLLIQFPHIYGGYVEFLGPILALFPRRMETLLLVFPVLNLLAVASLLITARLVLRHPTALFLAGLALLCIEFVPSMDDHYYPYAPIRTFFPALGLLAATRYFRRPTALRYGIASTLAALSPLWNIDTGVVLWLSWTAALIARNLGERHLLRAIQQLGFQVLFLVMAGVSFLLYLRLVSGIWPDPALFLTFPKLVLGAGYFCLPMLVPDAWMVILATYLLSLVLAFSFYVNRTSTWRTPVVVMIALMGTGLFLYFLGRSAESNLVSVSYPAILLMGLFLSETRTFIVLEKLPRLTWAFLLPFGLTLGWWATVGAVALPNLFAQSGKVITTWSSATDTPFRINVRFVQQQIAPGEPVFMLSNQSGFYSYLSATASPINLPSPGELLLSKDMDHLVEALNAARFPKLLVDQNFYTVGTYKAAIYQSISQAIATHYRAIATSTTGQVTLYVPR